MTAVRPTPDQLVAARTGRLADLLATDLRVVFVGINPSLYSAAVGHHFARPGNRFWPTLYAAGFTPRLLRASEQAELLGLRLGITNIAPRPTARAAELHADELTRGFAALRRKSARLRPQVIAFLGVTAYRIASGDRTASVGALAARWGGTALWVLPNPSGLNAHYQAVDLAREYAALRAALDH